jgi:hypothetical protein
MSTKKAAIRWNRGSAGTLDHPVEKVLAKLCGGWPSHWKLRTLFHVFDAAQFIPSSGRQVQSGLPEPAIAGRIVRAI